MGKERKGDNELHYGCKGKVIMKNIAFVILHYITYDDTIECVKSILNNRNLSKNSRIVVVDNGSPNESYRILEQEFQKDEYKKLGGGNASKIRRKYWVCEGKQHWISICKKGAEK